MALNFQPNLVDLSERSLSDDSLFTTEQLTAIERQNRRIIARNLLSRNDIIRSDNLALGNNVNQNEELIARLADLIPYMQDRSFEEVEAAISFINQEMWQETINPDEPDA